jgi:hypothetical protein
MDRVVVDALKQLPERQRFIEAARIDFQDYAMIGDATATLEDGILRLEIDLRPPAS